MNRQLLQKAILFNFLIRVFFIGAFILYGQGSPIYGQRVYADTDQVTSTIFAGVNNRSNALGSNPSTYSEVYATISLLGLTSAMQNLQFTGANGSEIPKPTSPMMIRFGESGALLGLINNISIQRTNGDINNPVGTEYTSTALADLLGLFSDDGATEVILPIPGTVGAPNDGVRLRVSSALGIAVSARLYYVFFITTPVIDNDQIAVCNGEDMSVTISNFYPGYIYRLYDSEVEGNQVGGDSDTDVLTVNTESQLITSGEYWIEAVEVNGEYEYMSARSPVTVTIFPRPGHPDLSITEN